QEEPLTPGVAVGPLGDPCDRHIIDTEFGQDLLRRAELPLAAIDQHEIGPHAALALGILLEDAAEAAAQHLAHHRVIVAASAGSAPTLPRLPRGPLPPPPAREGCRRCLGLLPPSLAGEGWGGGCNRRRRF